MYDWAARRGRGGFGMCEQLCPNCGLEKGEWSERDGEGGVGFIYDGALHCCHGCAFQTGCACATEQTPLSRQTHRRGASEQQDGTNG